MELELDKLTNNVIYYGCSYQKKFKSSRKYKYIPGTKEYVRNTYLLSVYKISLEDYNNLLIEQNFSCVICKEHMSKFKKNLSVDHDHKTGKVRGLLCEHCNHGLGKFKDDTNILKEAIKYLENNI
jgi:hypothetical protein